jgi:ATP/maltotriose-dependent transcriptional regulator MalT
VAVEDREQEAEDAFLAGRLEDAVQAWTHAHTEALHAGEVARSVRAAFWASFALLNHFDLARGGGWVDRGHRLLDEHELDVVERGYVTYCAALRTIFSGDPSGGYEGFAEAAATASRYGDRQLTTLALVGMGRCAIYLGRPAEGVALLDEAMVSVGADEISPIAVGDTYCTVIEGCQELYDVHRVREWTSAFSRWCDERPGVVLYHGHCLMRRAEVMQLRGEWQDAAEEADRCCARLATLPGSPIVGAALYLRAELHRLRGEHHEAELVYSRAHGAGRDPQPGLALLRLGQGRTAAARAAIDRALEECEDPLSRCRLLAAQVEIARAAGDLETAHRAATELAGVAEKLNAPYLRAQAGTVTGAVLLDVGDSTGAASTLRKAVGEWDALEAPYEAARARELLGVAYRRLGDEDGERLELAVAARTYKELGASPDSVRLEAPSTAEGPLSPREVEVLRLVAHGASNRVIAETLVISQKTVERHLSNIFSKLGLSSRSAATAYAFEHGLTG